MCNLGNSTRITSRKWFAFKNSSDGFDAKIYENDDACPEFWNEEDHPGSILLLVHQKSESAVATQA